MENLIVKGGWVMAPILLGSIVALTLVLERLLFLFRIRLDVPKFSSGIFSLIKRGNLKEAEEICQTTRHPLAAVFRTGLEHAGEEASEIERIMEREGNRQVQKAERNLNYLVVIIGVEPLYQAMITTAAGLAIAIPYFVIYNILLGKVNTITQDLNHYSDEFVGILKKAGQRAR